MSYQFLPHTADIKLYVEDRTFSDLCVDASNGLFEFLIPENYKQPEDFEEYEFEVEAMDQTALIIDLLSELLCTAQTDNVIFADFSVCEISETKISFRAKGYKVNEFRDDIKAITYHGAEVEKLENGNLAITITFDI